MEETILKIIEAAIRAPSGENCQPWLIKLSENKLNLYNDPSKDTSVYNYGQKGSMVAQGAFIENLAIASKALGLSAQLNMFPDPSNEDLIATVGFSQSSAVDDPLYGAIFNRSSNRKSYKKIKFTEEQRASILISGIETGSKVILLEDPLKIKDLSKPISLNEQLIFENQFLHDFFYAHIHWTQEEDEKYKFGFYIKTLELNLPQSIAIKLLRSWKWTNLLDKIGISKQIAKDNAKNYETASALGIIVIPTNSRNDYVVAGRAMERVWLKVTSMGLSLQPMTGILFFMQKILSGKHEEFSTEQVQLIKEGYQKISSGFDVTNQTIAMLFRIGDGGEPSAKSLRYTIPEIMQK
ncbi:MAG: hypothetical protein WDN47_04705 [Candidatus Doudnabacteria bacterium]